MTGYLVVIKNRNSKGYTYALYQSERGAAYSLFSVFLIIYFLSENKKK